MNNTPILDCKCYIVGTIIGAAGKALSSGLTSALNAQQQKEQRKWQQAENQKDRDFNASEAQKSRDYQERMYYEDRNYNSVANQMRQYAAAGLNPSLMMSMGAQSIQGTMPSAVAASTHGSSLPSGVTNSLDLGIDPLTMSAIEKNKADVDNTKEDTKSKQIENFVQDAIKYNRIKTSDIDIRFGESNASMSETRAKQFAEELAAINDRNRAAADKDKSETNLLAQEAAMYSEEWQAKQFDNFIKYYQLGYRIENSNDAINAIADLVSSAFLAEQNIKNNEALSRIRKNIADANDSIKSAKIKDFEIEELRYDHEQGAYMAEIDNVLYKWTIENNELRVLVDLSKTDEYKQNVKEIKQNEQSGDRRSSYVQSWTRPASEILKPAAQAADTYTKIRDAGYSAMDYEDGGSGSNDGVSETIREREVLTKDGKKVTLHERTRGSKASTSSHRSRGSKHKR